MSEFTYIGGFSGGIDSQAAARFMLNRYSPARVVLVNSTLAATSTHSLSNISTGMRNTSHPVVRIQAIVRDMWKTPEHAETRGYDGTLL